MVKLSLVFGALALAATANATCQEDITKCAQDYAASAQGAGADVKKVCDGLKTYKDCVVGTKDACTDDVGKTLYDAAVKAMEQVESSMSSACAGGGGSGGGGSGGGDTSGCDTKKAAEACADQMKAIGALPQDYTSSFKSFTTYCSEALTAYGAAQKCAAAQSGCGDYAKQMDAPKKNAEDSCKAGPTPDQWLAIAKKDEAFVTCMGDNMPTGTVPTCDQAKKMYECGKDFPAGTALNEACEEFKKAGDGCDLTCPKASTGAAADSSPDFDTGAASTAQISASVVIAAVAFAGLAN